ncbi:hypothetical protein [Suttonella ornithocola]|uniref:Uncharacterized protein n=1 Tax=Suttonella ornithocola TaxID=279832 RepID=A0A380MVU9_9GAMM|nr:hypothetical protein [Suttonella ornithocola]SUO95527.1 Uncharacterised protein [Suttonella ornithocola]
MKTLLLILLIILCLLLAVIGMLYLSVARREKQYGYPKANETDEDVKALIALNEPVLAIRCYRRIHGNNLKAARTGIERLYAQMRQEMMAEQQKTAQKTSSN